MGAVYQRLVIKKVRPTNISSTFFNRFKMSKSVLILPGIGNSGPQHWQSLWEQSNPNFERVQQRDWDHPICDEWAMSLKTAIQKKETLDVVLVAHSLACLVITHWANTQYVPIKAALLVAIPDPMGSNFPKEAVGFSVIPEQPFPSPSIVVASTDDPYGTVEYTSHIAKLWGSDLVNIGNCGHINANSGLSDWTEGYKLLTKLRS